MPVAELRRAGLSRPIKSPEDAIRVFPQLVSILTLARKQQGAPVGRLLWLIDEFQRVSEAGPKALREINTGLHSTFNSCPLGLSLVLSLWGTS